MRRIAVLTLLFFLFKTAVSQTPNTISFQRFSTEWNKIDKGLSQNSVYSLLQDKDGFMWFGTWDGLNKFDGYQFTFFRPDKDYKDKSISNETVRCLYEDNAGFLWIGTEEGLNKLNRNLLEFKQFKKDKKNPFSIGSDTIFTILGDENDLLYIGTNNGLSIFDKKTEVFFNIDLLPNPVNHNLPTKVYSLCMGSNAFLWIGTDNGLMRYDLITGETLRYSKTNTPELLRSDVILSMMMDKHGFMWIATTDGLIRINRKTKEIKQYFNIAGNTKSLSHNFTTAVFPDSKGNLWIGTSGGGINIYNYNEDNFTSFQYSSGKEKTLSNDYVNNITEDKFGNIWIATSKGVNRVDNAANIFNHYYVTGHPNALNNNTVWSIFEDSKNNLWIGTDGGINIIDRATGKFSFMVSEKNKTNTISSNQIRSVFEDSHGDFWIGTFDEGVDRYNPESKKISHFKNDKSLASVSNNQIWSIAEDRNSDLWFGSLDGLIKYDRKKDVMINYFYNEKNENSLSNNLIYNVYVDRKGFLWISTYNGLNKLDVNTMKFTRFYNESGNNNSISNNRIFSVYEDKDNYYWVATMGGGLNRYDDRTKTFKIYTENEGLANNIVYNILEDNIGNLWLSTNFGLSKFNKKTETFVNYDIQDGIQSSEFNLGAACKTKDGQLLFGGMNGFNIFSPEKFVENQQQPDIAITTFKVFNKPVFKQYKNSDTVLLSYYDNFFSFEFAALDFSNPGKIKYAFILENFDKGWTYTSADRRYAEYTNVPPGYYVFRVKATNSQGYWAKDEVKLYLVIKNVWWRTWWFKFLIIFIVLIIISIIVIDKLQKIRKKHFWDKQKLKFERQVFELKQKALSLQMNPHFIFNTLNSIQHFILKNNIDQAIQYMGKLSQLMRLILTDTREMYVPLINEIKILTHYMDLEKIRFNDKFEFSIHIDKAIDSEFLAVPPMLIQPFVENAVLHGIMHKKEKGNIKVTFKLLKEDIQCIVEDDGVGRTESARIKGNSGLSHTSRGISIIEDRLSLFDEKNYIKNRIIIEDITDNEGNVAGTRVTVLLPFIEI